MRVQGRQVDARVGVTLADAETYLALADEIRGPDWAGPSTFRFGASGLLDALLGAERAPAGSY